MRLGWSDHKWTALSSGVNTPKMHLGCIKIRSLRPHSEVVWASYGHILLAVCTRMWPGPHWCTAYSTDVLLVSRSMYAVQQYHIKVRQQATRTRTGKMDSRGWSTHETRWPISIWAEESVQRKLDDSYHNRAIYEIHDSTSSYSFQQTRHSLVRCCPHQFKNNNIFSSLQTEMMYVFICTYSGEVRSDHEWSLKTRVETHCQVWTDVLRAVHLWTEPLTAAAL